LPDGVKVTLRVYGPGYSVPPDERKVSATR
jgi:hypothetical protein